MRDLVGRAVHRHDHWMLQGLEVMLARRREGGIAVDEIPEIAAVPRMDDKGDEAVGLNAPQMGSKWLPIYEDEVPQIGHSCCSTSLAETRERRSRLCEQR